MALNRDKSIEERRRELDDEAEQYASRGIVSPGALKAARWISRLLWLAMSAFVVMLIFQLNRSVPETRYSELQNQHDVTQAELKKREGELSELTGPLLSEAARLGLVGSDTVGEVSLSRLALGIIDEGRKGRMREEQDALVQVELAEWRARKLMESGATSGTLSGWLDVYRKAAPEQKTAELALVAAATDAREDANREFFVALAGARDAKLAERVIAVRWLGARCREDAIARKMLESLLTENRAVLVNEARKALENMK